MGGEAGGEWRQVLVRGLQLLGRYEAALEVETRALEARPIDQQAIAYQGLAWRLLGDPRADRLNDYDRFISSRILQPPQGWGGVEQFNARLEQVLAALHMGNQHPLEQTLRGGTQTMGNLFRSEEHTSELQSLMRIQYAV